MAARAQRDDTTVADDTAPEVAQRARFPIVGIGASAGGLSAFQKFFQAMPADSGAAFVLVPHLDPTHKSLLVEILARQTKMAVHEARDAMPVEPNCVYIIPPNSYLAVKRQTLRLSPQPERHGATTALDFFFRTLAADQQERAIGIILSGTSSHGTLGLKEIKLAGGMMMVQLPESAEYDQMPQSAIATGLIDFVLAPEQMPEVLVKYLRHSYVHGPLEPTAEEVAGEQVTGILELLRASTKYDFRGYRRNMVLRRVLRRMGLRVIEQIPDYLAYLHAHPDEVTALHGDLLIGVTEFFRDPDAFQTLQQRVIPELIGQLDLSRVRVWVPACASGEEAYTIAILLIEQFTAAKHAAEIQIFATDVCERSLEIARQGVYPDSSLIGISPERLQRFFRRVDPRHWQVNKQLREAITFAPQNLISDAPFSKLNLISCRNLLIYLDPQLQAKIIRLFHFALQPGGYLFLGPSESIGRDAELFEPLSKKWRIFRSLGAARRELVEIPIVAKDEKRKLPATPHDAPALPTAGLKELMQRLILQDFAPAAVLINRRHEIVSVIGPLVNYLEFPPGEITRDLLAMARPGLRTKLRATIQRAATTGQLVKELQARVKRDGVFVLCSIAVRPIAEPKAAEGLLLVTFQDRSEATGHSDNADPPLTSPAEDTLLQHLEQELQSTREDLQATIEEYEGSTEELKVSNEEVMSMNEELQSANEELETSKEELQSLNEELNSVNSQLQEKLEELDRSNSDLSNLMIASEVALVFLDPELKIKRFTPAVARLLNLRPSDLDRPFGDFAPRFDDPALFDDCRLVLSQLMPIEREVWAKVEPDTAARCFLRRILPYRAVGNRIDGVVITFVDITNRIASEAQSRRLATVLQDSNDAITVQDFAGRILAWNRGAERMYGYTEAQALQMNIRDTMPPESRDAAVDYGRFLLLEGAGRTIGAQRVTRDGRVLEVELTVTAYRDEREELIGVATTERSVTDLKQAVKSLQSEATILRSVLDSLTAHVAVLDQHGQILRVNRAWERFAKENGATHLSRADVCANYLDVCQRAADEGDKFAAEALHGLRSVLDQQLAVFTLEYPCHSPREERWFILSASPIAAPQGGAVVAHYAITDRKQAEAALKDREERMRTILQAAADAIVTIDERGTITAANPATERMFGYTQAELVGSEIGLLMPPPYREEHHEYLARFLRTGEPRLIGTGKEVAGLRKDGSVFPVDLAVSRVNHLGLFTGIIRDISSRKELQKQVLEIAADEQRRIGQELHDGTGQELTGLSLFAGTLVDLLNDLPRRTTDDSANWLIDEAQLTRLRQTAHRLSRGLVEADRHVQQLSHGIMPVQIEVEGLRSALEELVATVDAQENVNCRLDCSEPVPVANNTTATHLYRIAQEAVGNALRHSGADQIRISLVRVQGRIVLEVGDNGRGFDTAAAKRPSSGEVHRGIGLEIMEYRAGMIGGLLQIESSPALGTVVRCTVLP